MNELIIPAGVLLLLAACFPILKPLLDTIADKLVDKMEENDNRRRKTMSRKQPIRQQ